MNQLVQVILANGQVVTTTLAAIQQQQQQQHHQQQTAAGIQHFVQQQQATTAQLVYNPTTGQTQVVQFATIADQNQQQQQSQQIVIPTVNGHQFLNPALMMQPQPQQSQQQQLPAQLLQLQLVNQIPAAAATQVLVNPATGQIVGQLAPQPFNLNPMPMIPSLNGQHQMVTQGITVQQASPVSNQQQQSPAPTVQNQAQYLTGSDATRLHVQRVIQQQQQQILQQQQQAHQQHNHRQPHVNVLIEQRIRGEEGKGDGVVKVVSPQGRVSSTTVNSAGAVLVSKSKQPPLILPAAAVIPSQTKAIATAFHVVTNPVVEGRVTVRETMLPDAGVHDDEEDEEDGDEESSQSCTSLSSTPSSCSRMEPESTTHSDSSSQATIAHTINTSSARIVDGVNLEDVQEFARSFKMRRLQLGMTQTQVGNALALSQGPTYSQSAICRYVDHVPFHFSSVLRSKFFPFSSAAAAGARRESIFSFPSPPSSPSGSRSWKSVPRVPSKSCLS